MDGLLQEFSLLRCRKVSTPFAGALELHREPEVPLTPEAHHRYRRVVGKLLWLKLAKNL